MTLLCCMIRVGLIGKTNTGKTTFFNAATLQSAKVSTYPFTTKKPNVGVAYVQMPCVCRELKVKDSPVNSKCIGGWRFIPIELIDLPGLIKGAAVGAELRPAEGALKMAKDRSAVCTQHVHLQASRYEFRISCRRRGNAIRQERKRPS